MADLTVIIITKNEERNIEKCINSFQGIAKRFVVVDSYSTDKTKEICKKLQVDFYEHEFISHSNQVNWALKNGNITTEWTMRIDADEELTLDLVKEINKKLNNLDKDINGIILKRRTYFMGKWIKHGGVYPTKLLRIFRTNKAFCEEKIMDEHMVLYSGKTVEFECDFIDNNVKSLEWWINKHNWYTTLRVRNEYINKIQDTEATLKSSLFGGQAERKRWIKENIYSKIPLFRRSKIYFIYRYIFKLGFLDGKEGLIYHFLQGYWNMFLTDAKIYEYKKNLKKY